MAFAPMKVYAFVYNVEDDRYYPEDYVELPEIDYGDEGLRCAVCDTEFVLGCDCHLLPDIPFNERT